jgi:hypothetical protein
MNTFHRFLLFRNPLDMISWNAVLGCETYDRLLGNPQEAERVKDVRSHHLSRMVADGITNSVLDPFWGRVPHFCYLGFALGEFGILPLDGRFGARWYPVKDVRAHWEKRPADSMSALERTKSRIELRYGVILKGPPQGSLP